MNLPPLHWDFCLECNKTLSKEEIAEDNSYCEPCLKALS